MGYLSLNNALSVNMMTMKFMSMYTTEVLRYALHRCAQLLLGCFFVTIIYFRQSLHLLFIRRSRCSLTHKDGAISLKLSCCESHPYTSPKPFIKQYCSVMTLSLCVDVNCMFPMWSLWVYYNKKEPVTL